MSADVAVFTVSPALAVPAWWAGGTARTRGTGRTGGTGLDGVRLKVDVLCLQIVELPLVGDQCNRLRDEHGDQHGAEDKVEPRSGRRFVHVAHVIPHSVC
ncbi:hypothetical protein ACWC9U_05490 [Streptomyces sp. 900116325]